MLSYAAKVVCVSVFQKAEHFKIQLALDLGPQWSLPIKSQVMIVIKQGVHMITFLLTVPIPAFLDVVVKQSMGCLRCGGGPESTAVPSQLTSSLPQACYLLKHSLLTLWDLHGPSASFPPHWIPTGLVPASYSTWSCSFLLTSHH